MTSQLQFHITPVTPLLQNSSLIWCPDTLEAAIVDPGGDLDRIMAAIKQHGVTPSKILLTHAHADHAAATAECAKRLELPIEGPHKGDQFWIDMLPQQCQMMNLAPVEIFTPDRWLEDGDQVSVGQLSLDVVHCPGHTPGHVVFVHKPSNFAIVGDVLFQGSIGRTDFPGGDFDTLIDSITKKLLPIGDEIRFIPGHGDMSTFGTERKTNPFVSGRYG